MTRFVTPCHMLILAAWLTTAAAHGEDMPENLDAYFDNAAVHYWKAITKLQPILNEGDLQTVVFIENRLPDLPPRAFVHRQDIGKWLLKERRMLTDLSVAGTKTFCAFNTRSESTTLPDMSHLTVLPDLWRRALACAKAFEFVDNHRQATTIYIALLRLFDNLDEDHEWTSAYFAVNQAPELLRAIVDYAGRAPPREELSRIVEYLKKRPPTQFPVRAYLRKEMRNNAKRLLDESAPLESKIEAFYKQGSRMPALEAIGGMSTSDKHARLIQWLDEYQEEVVLLASVLEKPYPEAIKHVREMDGRIQHIAKAPAAENPNYLLPLLMPPMERTYQQILAAEASFTVVRMVLIAATYMDFVGEWPEDYGVLETFGGAILPLNPFTEQPISYEVRREMPVFNTESPAWLHTSPLVLAVDLRKVIDRQDEALAELEEEIEKQDEARAVSPGQPAPVSERSTRPRRSLKATR